MNDMSREYSQLKMEIDDAISSVLSSGQYIGGPQVDRFERNWADYLDSPKVISCANGTDALQIALMALHLNLGDEIIMPAYGYIAAAEVAILLGLKPVIVDVREDYNIDPERIKEAITEKTKVILPLHLFGHCADLKTIMTIAAGFNLHVIEDAAQAAGASLIIDAELKKAGTVGIVGTFSHFPTKNLACYGDGGSICTDDLELAERMMRIKVHGQSQKYHHDIIGVNSRLDAIQAAILNVHLKYIDQFNLYRRKVASWYISGLSDNPGIRLQDHDAFHVYHQFPVQVDEKVRDQLVSTLKERGVASTVYYPKAFSQQIALMGKIDVRSDCVARKLTRSTICLPISNTIRQEEIDYICTVVNQAL